MKSIGDFVMRAVYSMDYRISNKIIDYKISKDPSMESIANHYEIVHVPVELIAHRCSENNLTKIRRQWSILFDQLIYKNGLILGGDWDLQKRNLDNCPHRQAFKERFIENKEWEETYYYESFHKKKKNESYIRGGAKNWEEYKIKSLSEWDNLYYSIRNNGYKSNYELTGKPEKEVIVCISRSGEIMRTPYGGGNHRFAMAKLLGIKEIPVVVSAWHEKYIEWIKNNTDIKVITPKTAIQPLLEGMPVGNREK